MSYLLLFFYCGLQHLVPIGVQDKTATARKAAAKIFDKTVVFIMDIYKLNRSNPFHLAAEVLLLDGCTLVVFLLTACKSNQKFGVTVVGNVKFYSDNG